MANPITGNLPAPHEHISISVTKHFNSWHVTYTGTPKQLVAAGVVDDDMERKILSAKGGARLDKLGLQFTLRRRDRREPASVQWKRGETVTLERRSGTYHLLKLPGMVELFPNGAPDDEQRAGELTPDELVAQFPTITIGMAWVAHAMASRIGASSVRNASLRVRCVGSRRRPAQWLSIGKVIAPNWGALARTA